jgi:hypothetical protein
MAGACSTRSSRDNVTYEIVRQHRARGRHGDEDDDDDRW